MMPTDQLIDQIQESPQRTERMAIRSPHLAEKIVFVDGMPGCGKTMLSPIIAALPRVELLQYAYEIEYVCSLRFLKRMEADAATTLVRMLTDLKLYNVMMSRETNFRLGDLSSALMDARPFRYFRRLFQAGDAAVLERIHNESPILHLTTHNILGYSESLFEALNERLIFIEVVRHPLYMIRQHKMNTDRYGIDVRDFTIWYKWNQTSQIPYFAAGWEDLYLNSNPTDRAIYSFWNWNRQIDVLKQSRLNEWQKQVIIVPFERFVLDPQPYMRQIESAMGTQADGVTRQMMKKQRVPRQRIAAGRPLPIYKQYGWQPPLTGDEREELRSRHAEISKEASCEAMDILDQMSVEYEAAYMQDILS